MLNADQTHRIRVLLNSSVGADLLAFINEQMPVHFQALMNADDVPAMFRAQGRVAALTDLVARLHSVKQMADPEG